MNFIKELKQFKEDIQKQTNTNHLKKFYKIKEKECKENKFLSDTQENINLRLVEKMKII